MEIQTAREIAVNVRKLLEPYCERIEVAGSIRRRRPFVHDIDIVLIPANQGQLLYQIQQLGTIAKNGPKLLNINPSKYGVPIDIYVATPETWATLLLIRTGSKQHNIKLCTLARNKGYILHADGSGLFQGTDCESGESRVAGDTEESIFRELGLAYVPPEKRE